MRTVMVLIGLAGAAVSSAFAQPVPRARDLGIPFDFGRPGPLNAITDVAGVEVGHVTLVEGTDVRTGVTAVMPRGKGEDSSIPCLAGYFSLNGNGEMTGIPWLEESGFLEGPVLITNTNAVGTVRDAVIRHARQRFAAPAGWSDAPWSLPVVAETWDGHLNDIYGGHVKPEHAVEAMTRAAGGPVAEGSVGGGTGMVCFEFKCGIGSASRRLEARAGGYTVGVLVQANFGRRHQLRIAGLPLGRTLGGPLVYKEETGSVIVVVATDAPLLPNQLARLARRAALGIARTGGTAGNGSGDLMVAFSTARTRPSEGGRTEILEMLPNDSMNPLFEATVAATEEAIINALVAGRTMTGREGHQVVGLPQQEVKDALLRHGLWAKP